MCAYMSNREGSEVERVTSEDLELMNRLADRLRPSQAEPGVPGLIRDINRILLSYDERRLRLVYFFAKGLQ